MTMKQSNGQKTKYPSVLSKFNQMSSIFSQDTFTERLLKVYYDLHGKGAIEMKKDFTGAIGITLNYFHLIERNMRNYARSEEKRMNARAGLFEKYGVNPDYLKETSERMYLRDPDVKRKDVKTKEEVEFSYYGKKQKRILEQELEYYKQKAEQLEERVHILEEELVKYRTSKPDTKQSKTKKDEKK